MSAITKFEHLRDSRNEARKTLERMKEMERKRAMVSVRLDDNTVISTTEEQMEDLKQRHGYGKKKKSARRMIR